MEFVKKKISPTKRICLRLKEARDTAGISLETVAAKLRINKQYVVALESCEFEQLPFAPVYQKHLIRRYIETIGLDPKSFLDQFVYEEMRPSLTDIQAAPARKPIKFQNFPTLVRVAGIAAITLSLIGYLAIQVKQIIEPPELAVFHPENGFITPTPTLTIQGKTDQEAVVFINGKEIAANDTGYFQESLTLTDGVNTLIFSAKKKHGKTTELTRHVVYKKTDRLSANTSHITLIKTP